MYGTREYTSWRGILQRCTNPNIKNYSNYGGRGIRVCKRWIKFGNFYQDMGKRPPGKSIDRKDNNKNYKKSNCRWATPTEQRRNQRTQKTKTGVTGVWWDKKAQKYQAKITVNYKQIFLGMYKNLEEAAGMRVMAEQELWS